jgi:AcrR family transcriptional regulator
MPQNAHAKKLPKPSKKAALIGHENMSQKERVRDREERASSRGTNTKDALIAATLEMIAQKGIAGVSVLEITQSLSISNGAFYYHFESMDKLLEQVGHTVVANLVERIEAVQRPDPAAQVARGPLIILGYIDQHPEFQQIMLRVIEDQDNSHANLEDSLFEDVKKGRRLGRFAVEDLHMAVRFCRAVIGSAVRFRPETDTGQKHALSTSIHTLTMLGLPYWEAHDVAERERLSIEGTEPTND